MKKNSPYKFYLKAYGIIYIVSLACIFLFYIKKQPANLDGYLELSIEWFFWLFIPLAFFLPLIARIFNVNVFLDNPLHSELVKAIEEGNTKIVLDLLHNSVGINETIEMGYTSLLLATYKNNFKIVKLLLENGADVNAQSRHDRKTALMLGSMNGNIEIVEILTQYDADIDLKDNYARSAFDFAKNKPDILKLLFLARQNKEILRIEAEEDNLELDEDVIDLENESEINNALITAVINGYYDKVKLLVEKNADVNYIDDEGLNSVYYAVDIDDFEITEYLIEKGAEINVVAKDNSTPLQQAVLNGNIDIVKLLVNNGAKLNAIGAEGKTALSTAKDQKELEIVDFLKSKGAWG